MSELLGHLLHVVLGRRGVGSNAEGDAVVPRVHCLEQRRHVVARGAGRRQPEDRPRRVVRVDGHVDPSLLAARDDLSEEVGQVLPHLLTGHALVFCDRGTELFDGVGLDHAPWKACDHILLQTVLGVHVHAVQASLGACSLRIGVLCLCTLTLEDEQIEGCQIICVVGKRFRAVRPASSQICPRPVQHRHEIVANPPHAALAEIQHRLLVGLDVLAALWLAELDALMDWHRFHH
mmetsp:Transcript_44194/g.80040  ORF Transcript_44194/g.80040 Transcript_44194/m.80040 type:complete len:234 (-) Transcript_44194:303-1004(-)